MDGVAAACQGGPNKHAGRPGQSATTHFNIARLSLPSLLVIVLERMGILWTYMGDNMGSFILSAGVPEVVLY